MLDLGWTEILMIGVIAVVVIGPKDLPKAMHAMAQWMRKLRGMARDFQGQVDDMVKGTELEEVKKAAQGLNRYSVKRQISNVVDPKGQMKKALEETRRAANERSDTSSAGMATPPDAGDAVAEASIGGGVGGARRPSIEDAEPTPADDEAAVAAMRGDPPAEAAQAEQAPKRKPARRSAAASGAAAKTSGTGKAAATRSSTRASAAKPRRKPATVAAEPEADGAAPMKAEGTKPTRPAKGANGATPPAEEAALPADDVADGDPAAPESGAGSTPAGGKRRTRKPAPARRKAAGDNAPSDAAAAQGE
jgi:sec-independent protein translocase protein TatB